MIAFFIHNYYTIMLIVLLFLVAAARFLTGKYEEGDTKRKKGQADGQSVFSDQKDDANYKKGNRHSGIRLRATQIRLGIFIFIDHECIIPSGYLL